MAINMKQLIKIQCVKSGNISIDEVARRCGWLSPNIWSRINNNTWLISDLEIVATKAFNCTLYVAFKYGNDITTAPTVSDLIRIQCILSDDITHTELAKRLNWSRASLSQRMTANRWRLRDLEKIADALNCKLIIEFHPISS